MGTNLDKAVLNSPLTPFLEEQGFVILDGGLATELEKRGYDLNDRLWSARLLDSNPEAIADVHRTYLQAGADCIITASYQASIPGFLMAGYSKKEAISLLERSVEIACKVRDEFASGMVAQHQERLFPLVAASIGPYGAYLADGSEYRGKYPVSAVDLYAFHEERLTILAGTPADLLACETIPGYQEAEVLRDLISKFPGHFFWVSFSCRDEHHIYDGTPVGRVVSLFTDCPQVLAIGVNCTAPKFISDLIGEINLTRSKKEMIIYPNSGESYNAKSKKWIGESDPYNFAMKAKEWFNNGARLIGGCCRTGPEHINKLRLSLQQQLRRR